MNIKDITYSAIGAAVMAICAWISIPTPWHIAFTMQTFGVFAVTALLGGKRGTLAVAIYKLLGLAGLPVFSGFNGGAGTLLGATGGYILGFIPMCAVIWAAERFVGGNMKTYIISALAGLVMCYAVGTLWYCGVFLGRISARELASAMMLCVVPYIAFDLIKLSLAAVLRAKLKNCLFS